MIPSTFELPRARYRVFLVDPPWRFVTRSPKGRGRSPDGPLDHYQTMTFDELRCLPLAAWAAPDSALLMWAIDPMLPQALALGGWWGFTYKTVGFYWVKTAKDGESFPMKMGYWTRGNPEQCLLFTRGAPKRLHADVRRLIVSPVREHSRKPDEIYPRIERLVAGPYVELFARQSRPGWDSWGQERTKYDGTADTGQPQRSAGVDRQRGPPDRAGQAPEGGDAK